MKLGVAPLRTTNDGGDDCHSAKPGASTDTARNTIQLGAEVRLWTGKMTAESMDGVTRDLEKLDFHHPYTPYDVQEQFMKTVFDVLEAGDGHVGILESPTGTVSF